MRTKKYRAWDKTFERMLYTDWGSFRNWYNESKRGKVVYERGFDGEKLHLSEPMEYLGLLDKNKQEIFEGDRAKGTHPNFSESFEGTIVYDEEQAGFFLTAEESHHIFLGDLDEIEIIGHIYENPQP